MSWLFPNLTFLQGTASVLTLDLVLGDAKSMPNLLDIDIRFSRGVIKITKPLRTLTLDLAYDTTVRIVDPDGKGTNQLQTLELTDGLRDEDITLSWWGPKPKHITMPIDFKTDLHADSVNDLFEEEFDIESMRILAKNIDGDTEGWTEWSIARIAEDLSIGICDLNLFKCKSMVLEFPTQLSLDHALGDPTYVDVWGSEYRNGIEFVNERVVVNVRGHRIGKLHIVAVGEGHIEQNYSVEIIPDRSCSDRLILLTQPNHD